MEKRVVNDETRTGLRDVRNLILIGVMMAVGIVLRLFASVLQFGNMRPNFLIATYCLSILIVRPKTWEAAIIGFISGAISQIGTGYPWIGLGSETLGAVAMCLLITIPMPKIIKPVACTCVSTLISGFAFIGLVALFYDRPMPAAQFAAMSTVSIVTALLNMVIVTILAIPVNKVMGIGRETK